MNFMGLNRINVFNRAFLSRNKKPKQEVKPQDEALKQQLDKTIAENKKSTDRFANSYNKWNF